MASVFEDKHLFYAELAKLTQAGFGIPEALKAMAATGTPIRQSAWLDQIETGLNKGRSIAQAFSSLYEDESGVEQSILHAGERSGRLAPALQHLADYFGMLSLARKQSLQALIYPALLLHLGMVAAVFPKGWMQGKATGEMLGTFGMVVLCIYAVVAGLAWVCINLLKQARFHPQTDALLNRIPIVRAARRNLAMARFTKVHHACTLAGICIIETVEIAAQASQSAVIVKAAIRLTEAAKNRTELGPVLIASPAFPKAFARSYATAEQSGMLDRDLESWATVFQNDAERTIRIAASAIPKFFYAIVVAYVVWQIVGFYLGYVESLDRIVE